MPRENELHRGNQERERSDYSIDEMKNMMPYDEFFCWVEEGDSNALKYGETNNQFRTPENLRVYLTAAFGQFINKPEDVYIIRNGIATVDAILQGHRNAVTQNDRDVINEAAMRRLQEFCLEFGIVAEGSEAVENTPTIPEIPKEPETISLKDFQSIVEETIWNIAVEEGGQIDLKHLSQTPLFVRQKEAHLNILQGLLKLGVISSVDQPEINADVLEKFNTRLVTEYSEKDSSLEDALIEMTGIQDETTVQAAHSAWQEYFAQYSHTLEGINGHIEKHAVNVGAVRFEGEPYVKDWADKGEIDALLQFYKTKKKEVVNRAKPQNIAVFKKGTRVAGMVKKVEMNFADISSIEPGATTEARLKRLFGSTNELLNAISIEFENRKETTAAVKEISDETGDFTEAFDLQVNPETKIGAIYKRMRELRKQVKVAADTLDIDTYSKGAKRMNNNALDGIRSFRKNYAELADYLAHRAAESNDRQFGPRETPQFSDEQVAEIQKRLNKLFEYGQRVIDDVDTKLDNQALSGSYEHFVSTFDDIEEDTGSPFIPYQEESQAETIPKNSAEMPTAKTFDEQRLSLQLLNNELSTVYGTEVDFEKKIGPLYQKQTKSFGRQGSSIAEMDVRTFLKKNSPADPLAQLIRKWERQTGINPEQAISGRYGGYTTQSVEGYLRTAAGDITLRESENLKSEGSQLKMKTAAEEFKKIKVPPLIKEKKRDVDSEEWRKEVTVPAGVKNTTAFALGRFAAFGASKIRNAVKNIFGRTN